VSSQNIPPMYSTTDTIAAVASAPGGAARGIVRLSGPAAHACAAACFQLLGSSDSSAIGAAKPQEGFSLCVPPGDIPFGKKLIQPFGKMHEARIVAGALRLDGFASPLPCEAYFWPEGRSYTGQAAVEFHTVGSPPLLDALLQTLCARGVRLARPGEFTLRAFLSGRIDLTQAEAVLGAIDAAGDEQFEAALKQLAGGLSGPLRLLRHQLLDLLARLEAGFDFADEDIDFIAPDELEAELQAAEKQVAELLRRIDGRTLSEPAVRVVFVGRPNTGKSSLFNALIRRAGAIVSPHPGTTRDYLTAEDDLDGIKCTWIDTAGISPEGSFFEKKLAATDAEAQAVAGEQHAAAAICLLCIEAGRPTDAWERDFLAKTPESSRLVVLTKRDLCQNGKMPLQPGDNVSADAIPTSSATGEGLDELRAALRRLVRESDPSEVVSSTAARCRESLDAAAASLCRAGELAAANEELIASEIRSAVEALGQVAGTVYTEDLLDCIFSRFCVGK
jgi:tRNA modification GTPase